MLKSCTVDGDYIMSPVMAKCTGLYYIIDPKSAKLGGHNVFHVAVMAMITFTAVVLSLCPFGLYYWSRDMTQFVLQSIIFGNFLFGCFKAYTVLKHSDDIRRCLEVTRLDFVATVCADPEAARFFRKCRDASSTFTGWFAAINHFVLIVWTLFPFAVDEQVVTRNHDGSTSYYHFNPYNMYFMVSSATYNQWHLVFHLLEWLLGLCFVLTMVLFDTFMVTMCMAITFQMRGIAAAYKKLGHSRRTGAPNKVYFSDQEESNRWNNECLNDLKLVIMDHQEVLGIMRDFYKIVRPVILPQLVVASSTIIFLSFVLTLKFFNGTLLTSAQSLKMCCFPTFFFQIYYTCLVFGNLNNQKNVMNFEFYSCNWTQMETKFKKLLFLAMKMHDANKLNMKLTADLIINLELFTSVINLCYSIFSVLVKSQLNLTDKI